MKQVYKESFSYPEFNRLDKPRQILALYICMCITQSQFVFVLQFFVISIFLFLLITMKGVHNAKQSAISFKQFVPLVLTYMGNTCDYILIIHKFINAGD